MVAAVPATMGLMGNASFAERLPVRSPSATATAEDRGGDRLTHASDDPATHDAGDDKGGDRPVGVSDDDSLTHAVVDDHGGDDSGQSSDDSGTTVATTTVARTARVGTDPTTGSRASASPTAGPPVGDTALPGASPPWWTVSRGADLGGDDRLVRPRRVVAQLLLGVLAACRG